MKKIKYIIGATIFALLLGACSSNKKDSDIYLDRPEDTNLEFWITQKASFEDLDNKGCTYLPGWMGADEYLDSRYTADTSGDMAVAPDIHVTYLVTGYPDTLDDRTITHIEITDPSIVVYGLTLNSTDNEIINRITDKTNSFSYVTAVDECYLKFTIKNCSFSFMSNKIIIDVPVTNNSGIVY